MIYAVQIQDGKFVKIGYSANEDINCRIAQLQTGCPYEITEVLTTYGTLYQEKAIHSSLRVALGRIRVPSPPNEWYHGKNPFFVKFLDYLKYGPDAAMAYSERFNPAIKQGSPRPGKTDCSPVIRWPQ